MNNELTHLSCDHEIEERKKRMNCLFGGARIHIVKGPIDWNTFHRNKSKQSICHFVNAFPYRTQSSQNIGDKNERVYLKIQQTCLIAAIVNPSIKM